MNCCKRCSMRKNNSQSGPGELLRCLSTYAICNASLSERKRVLRPAEGRTKPRASRVHRLARESCESRQKHRWKWASALFHRENTAIQEWEIEHDRWSVR